MLADGGRRCVERSAVVCVQLRRTLGDELGGRLVSASPWWIPRPAAISATVQGRRDSRARISISVEVRSPPEDGTSAITSADGLNKPASSCSEPPATAPTNVSAGGRTAVLSWMRSGAMRTASCASRSTCDRASVMPASSMTSSQICPAKPLRNVAIPSTTSAKRSAGCGRLTSWNRRSSGASSDGSTMSAAASPPRTSGRLSREPLVMTATGTSVSCLMPAINSPSPVCRVGSPDPASAMTSGSDSSRARTWDTTSAGSTQRPRRTVLDVVCPS